MSRKLKGEAPTKPYSIRIPPELHELLTSKFGSIQKSWDFAVEYLKKAKAPELGPSKEEVEFWKKKKPPTLS